MTKAVVGMLAAVMALSIGATNVFAAAQGYGSAFSDNDGDGICDYAGSACRYTDADNDGICDNCGMYQKSGISQSGCDRNFIDLDGDGVCDHHAARQGTGHGRGAQGGRGR